LMRGVVTALDQCFDLELPASKEFDVVGLGQNAVDHVCLLPEFPRRDGKTEILGRQRLAGGQVATAIASVARLGLKGKYIGKVGSDEDGLFCLSKLISWNIDTRSVRVQEGARNHYSLIVIDQSRGERTILWERDPKLNFEEQELGREEVCAGRLLLLDDHDPLSSLRAAKWAREEGIPIMADFDRDSAASRELLPLIDFLIVSSNFPSEHTGIQDAPAALLALAPKCGGFVAATQGAAGVMAVVGKECIRFPGFRVEAVDTTGAGDVFHGAFLYGLIQNWPVARIMSFANAAGAINCTHVGASSHLPRLQEVIDLAATAPGRPENM
jgi:sulfofructose kinase